MGGDYDVAAQKLQPKWQVESALGKAVDLRVNEDGCTVSKNWDADLGALSCNVELKAHCTWNGRVRASCPSCSQLSSLKLTRPPRLWSRSRRCPLMRHPSGR